VAFKQVQVGGLGSGNGRTSVVKGISVDKTDIANLTFVQDVSFHDPIINTCKNTNP
jgi:mannose/fructose/N-acetylgalactosamine-specific phosphotransferase system component IIB